MRSRQKLNGVNFQQISIGDNLIFIADFKEDEVKEVILNCGNDKSANLNGFIFLFMEGFWETMKPEVMIFFREFHRNGVLSRGANSSFISLVAKYDNPQLLGDYRPISMLVGCIKS